MNLTLEASGIWLQNFHRARETDSWRSETKTCVYQDPGERSSDPIKHWARLPVSVQESPMEGRVNSGLLQGLLSLFEGGCHYCHYPYLSLASGQTIGREHSPTHQQNIGLKINWVLPHPWEQDPDSPTASPFHQEAFTNLLSLFIRGQTEWNLQSQKTNQTDHMDHSLV